MNPKMVKAINEWFLIKDMPGAPSKAEFARTNHVILASSRSMSVSTQLRVVNLGAMLVDHLLYPKKIHSSSWNIPSGQIMQMMVFCLKPPFRI